MSKDNANQSAFPSNISSGDWKGLTKREYFAAMAMQGLLANSASFDILRRVNASERYEILAETAIKNADEILKQLEP